MHESFLWPTLPQMFELITASFLGHHNPVITTHTFDCLLITASLLGHLNRFMTTHAFDCLLISRLVQAFPRLFEIIDASMLGSILLLTIYYSCHCRLLLTLENTILPRLLLIGPPMPAQALCMARLWVGRPLLCTLWWTCALGLLLIILALLPMLAHLVGVIFAAFVHNLLAAISTCCLYSAQICVETVRSNDTTRAT